jgi:hypothetical protein
MRVWFTHVCVYDSKASASSLLVMHQQEHYIVVYSVSIGTRRYRFYDGGQTTKIMYCQYNSIGILILTWPHITRVIIIIIIIAVIHLHRHRLLPGSVVAGDEVGIGHCSQCGTERDATAHSVSIGPHHLHQQPHQTHRQNKLTYSFIQFDP